MTGRTLTAMVLSMAFCFSVLAQQAEDPATKALKAAFAELMTALKGEADPDPKTVGPIVDRLQSEAEKLVSNSEVSEEVRLDAYDHALMGLLIALPYDESALLPRLQKLAATIQAKYPGDERFERYHRRAGLPGSVAELVGPTLDGKEFNLKAWKGKVVVIDFWATWCKPCVAMTPDLLKLYSDFHEQGLEMVGVTLDQEEQRVREYLAEKKIPWSQIRYPELEEAAKVATNYGTAGIPMVFVVDRQGRVKGIGSHKVRRIRELVEEAISEESGR